MPDLFGLLPGLERVSHPLLDERRITVVGVSGVLYDEQAFTFEVTRPRHWGRREDGRRIVGVGGIGGRVEAGESVLECLFREVREEIGAGFWLEPAAFTALIHDGEMAGWLDVPETPFGAAPYMVNLLPPQLERPDRPDHLAIVSFRGVLRGQPRRGDLFGLLRIEPSGLELFFERAEWRVDEAQALPGLTFDLAFDLPADALLRPTLTGRAFQVLLKHTSGL